MARLAVVVALLAGVSAGCGFAGFSADDDPEPLATKSSAPIAFLRAHGPGPDPETGVDERLRELVIIDPDGSNERTVRTPRYDVESFSWSPDGRRLVFAAHSQDDYRRTLFVVNADGQGLRRLRTTPDHSPNPVWSPRGDMIVWDNHDDGLHEVWVMNADGSGARRLAPASYGGNPIWSPDGTKIAWGNQGWNVMNADGSGKKRLPGVAPDEWTPAGMTYRTSRGIGLFDPDRGATRLAVMVGEEWQQYRFSRDGRTVVLSGPIKPGGDWELGLTRVPGRVVRLTSNLREDLSPSFSSDAKSLAFERFGAEQPGDIYVMNADGTGERNLTDSPADESAPAWAPGTSSLTPI